MVASTGQGGDAATASSEPADLGEGIMLKTGRFGPYVEQGEKRASIPKDVQIDLEWAQKLLSLPREIGTHPETGEMITASMSFARAAP